MSSAMRKAALWLAAGLAAAAVAAWLLKDGREPATSDARESPRGNAASSSSLPCHQVLRCAAAQAIQEASTNCRAPIEQLAVYAPRWTQRAGDPIFTDYAWHDEKRGTITYFGNRAEFRNASGGFNPVAYECDWDPSARVVLDVRAKGAGA